MYKCVLLIIYLSLGLLRANPIPINLSVNGDNKGNLEFNLLLPNNETLKIDLSFQLMKITHSLDNNTSTLATTTTEVPKPQYFTVVEAIEAFRQDLIQKEKDIAGIIESEKIFYRHFKLEYDQIDLTIRCTYDSNYKKT